MMYFCFPYHKVQKSARTLTWITPRTARGKTAHPLRRNYEVVQLLRSCVLSGFRYPALRCAYAGLSMFASCRRLFMKFKQPLRPLTIFRPTIKKCNIYGQRIRAYTTGIYERIRPSYTSVYDRRIHATLRNGEKSRRDDTLLTGGFNRRSRRYTTMPKSRRDGTTSPIQSVVPAGLWREHRAFLVRRLKSTVNRVSSLRDFEGRLFRLFRRLKPPVNQVPSLRDFTADTTLLQVVYFSSPNISLLSFHHQQTIH